MRKLFYLSAVVLVAVAPSAALVGCAGITGNKEIDPPALFVSQFEFETPAGVKVQIGIIDNDPSRIGQRQEYPDGTVVWLEKVDAWIPGAVTGTAAMFGQGALGGGIATLLTLGGTKLAKRKWLTPNA